VFHTKPLHVVAATSVDDAFAEYEKQVIDFAEGHSSVVIHRNIDNAELYQLYRRARILWGANGMAGSRVQAAEHFGYTPVEAWSACCIPVVYDRGGHKETVAARWRWDTIDGLRLCTQDAMSSEPSALREVVDVNLYNEDYYAWQLEQYIRRVNAMALELQPIEETIEVEPHIIRVGGVSDSPRLTTGFAVPAAQIYNHIAKQPDMELCVFGMMDTDKVRPGEKLPYAFYESPLGDLQAVRRGSKVLPDFINWASWKKPIDVILEIYEPGNAYNHIMTLRTLGVDQPMILYFPIEGLPPHNIVYELVSKVQYPVTYCRSGYEAVKAELPDSSLSYVYHGVDHAPFAPLEPEMRDKWRQLVGWEDKFVCFPADTSILMSGYRSRPIDSVEVGEEVVTHQGNNVVIDTQKRFYDGNVIRISFWGGLGDIVATEEHPIFAVSKDSIICDKCKSFRERRYVCRQDGNVQYKNSMCSKCTEPVLNRYEAEFVSAKSISKGDFLLYPIDGRIEDLEAIDLSWFGADIREGLAYTKYTKNPIPSRIPIDDAFLRIAGWFVSEGSFRRSRLGNPCSINFTQRTKSLMHDEIHRYFATYGLEAKKYDVELEKHDDISNTVVGNKTLGIAFENMFGSGAKNKKLPQFMMRLPLEKQYVLLEALMEGDGHIRDREYVYITTSETLAFQVRQLMLRLGFPASISRGSRESHAGWSDVFHVGYSPERDVKIRRGKFIYDGYLWCQVTSIVNEEYSGLVYNLSVLDDNTYMANGILVHNCMNVGSNKRVKQQPYLIEAMRLLLEWGHDDIYMYLHTKRHDSHIMNGWDLGWICDRTSATSKLPVSQHILFPPEHDKWRGVPYRYAEGDIEAWRLTTPPTPQMRGATFGSLDMITRYGISDLYIDVSSAEGWNLPPLEAVACGVPTISVDDGHVRSEVHSKYCWDMLKPKHWDVWHTSAILQLVDPVDAARAIINAKEAYESAKFQALDASKRVLQDLPWESTAQFFVDLIREAAAYGQTK